MLVPPTNPPGGAPSHPLSRFHFGKLCSHQHRVSANVTERMILCFPSGYKKQEASNTDEQRRAVSMAEYLLYMVAYGDQMHEPVKRPVYLESILIR